MNWDLQKGRVILFSFETEIVLIVFIWQEQWSSLYGLCFAEKQLVIIFTEGMKIVIAFVIVLILTVCVCVSPSWSF